MSDSAPFTPEAIADALRAVPGDGWMNLHDLRAVAWRGRVDGQGRQGRDLWTTVCDLRRRGVIECRGGAIGPGPFEIRLRDARHERPPCLCGLGARADTTPLQRHRLDCPRRNEATY